MAAITKQLVQQVDQWIARHRDEMVDEVCRLIRFPSVADPSGVPPYGQNCREVLDAYRNGEPVEDGESGDDEPEEDEAEDNEPEDDDGLTEDGE